ncbi:MULTISPECIES: aminotransferase-like domain-containing protein [Giesbergeria]|uniref:PLP-dependent aminotransferase family protein n=1 Tax=Giesbergeria sinuosa TaxID=80883 RepID=A0ABV9QG38_9BURK
MASAPELTPSSTSPLYAQIAQRMALLIDHRAFKPGQRLPSVRDLAATNGVSISTAVQALRWLEERNLVEARPKSGYFVAQSGRALALPATSRPPRRSMVVERQSRAEVLMALAETSHVVSFGGACPKDPLFFDETRVRTALNRATRAHRFSLVEYSDSPGSQALRTAAVQRALHLGCQLEADNIVVTASCIHAVGLCLRAVSKPGDIVALESPTHFGFLDLLESLNLRVLEIPTHPKEGISLAALQLALDTQPVKAVLTVPTLSNPLGAVMRHQNKKALVKMLADRQIPLIEDVVFNDLMASDERRKAAKAFDVDGGVMVCGSFSKTVAPGIRLGWVEAGRWHDTVRRLKRTQGVPTNAVLENALADLVTQVGYESRLRRLSQYMKERLSEARDLIAQSFPKGTRVSAPPSGYTLWLELPEQFDAMQLFRQCQREDIIFGPGGLFSATDRFDHCLRLSFAGPWTHVEKRALVRMGELARQQMGVVVAPG